MIFDEFGNCLIDIPTDCVLECWNPKENMDLLDKWIYILQFKCPKDLAIPYLREMGAWDDLDTADQDTINRRVLWLACCDIRKNGEWFGLIR